MFHLERRIEGEAAQQVRIGDARLAEGTRVGLAGGDRGLGGGLVEALVAIQMPPNAALTFRPMLSSPGASRRTDEGDAALAELAGRMGEGGEAVGIAHAAGIAPRFIPCLTIIE